MTKHICALITCTLLGTWTFSQSFIVRHDYINNNTDYLRITSKGDTVKLKSPVAKANQDVKIEVTNFNGFVWTGDLDVTTEDVQLGGHVHSVLDVLTPYIEGGVTSVIDMVQGGGISLGGLGGLGFGSEQGTAEQRELLSQITDKAEPFLEAWLELQQIGEQLNAVSSASSRLRELKYSTTLESSAIKSGAREAAIEVFGGPGIPQASDASRLSSKTSQAFALHASRAEGIGSEYVSVLEYVVGSASAQNIAWLGRQLEMPLPQLLKETEDAVDVIPELKEEFALFDLGSKLTQAFKMYDEIANASFRFSDNFNAEGDRATLSLKVFKNPHLAEALLQTDTGAVSTSQAALEPVVTKSFKVQVKGGMKFSSSLGVTFPTFGNKPQDFFNQDSIIASASASNFVPHVSTLLHVYPYSGTQTNLSGTFGVGIPVSDEGLSLNFMLGASILFGRGQQFGITAGVVTGPLDQLAAGFELGDKLQSEFEPVPMRKSYNLGAFAGLSFSLGGN